MNMLDQPPVLCATDIAFTTTHITTQLADGRAITVPLWWYPKLLRATSEQRGRWTLISNGLGIHWEEIGEDLSVRGMLYEFSQPVPSTEVAYR